MTHFRLSAWCAARMKLFVRHGVWWIGTGLIVGVVAERAWLAPRTARNRATSTHRIQPQPASMIESPPPTAPITFDAMLQGLRPADVPRTLAFLATLPPGEDRTVIAAELLRRWARETPTAAIDYVARDSAAGNPLLTGLLSEPLQEQTAAEQARDSSQEALPSVLAALFANWTTTDPEAAALKALHLGSASQRELMLQVVLEKWAHENLAAAVEWVKGVPAGPEHAGVLQSIAPEWAARDLNGASAYAAALPEGSTRAQFLKTVAESWAAQGASAAMAWIKTLPDTASRGDAVRSALGSVADSQPAAAAEWLRQLPDGLAQREGTDLVLNLWAARDLAAAVGWFQTLPPGPLRDQALHTLAGAWVACDPQRVINAAASIAEPAARLSELEHVARVWLGRDPTAARAWLARADLPAELRARLGQP